MPNTQLRNVARFVFPRELNHATYTYSYYDRDKAPVYALLPTGVPANRVCLCGTVTAVTDLGTDGDEFWEAEIVDFAGEDAQVYAGRYDARAATFLAEHEPPIRVFLVGKPRTYSPEEASDQVYVSVQAERITQVSQESRIDWTAVAAGQTVDRLAEFKSGETRHAEQAQEYYGDISPQLKQDTITNADTALQQRDSL